MYQLRANAPFAAGQDTLRDTGLKLKIETDDISYYLARTMRMMKCSI